MPGPVPPQGAKILLDTPSVRPALGFENTARALAGLVIGSTPRFALGIFGGWGSGKTTLMEAIREHLSRDNSVVVVDFNAWRFEREPQLLVPLLDTIRSALLIWSSTCKPEAGQRVRDIAQRIAHVVRALAAGLSGQIGIPGGPAIAFDLGKTADTLTQPKSLDGPQSLYVASFTELSEAFGQLRETGATRIVVLIDDLDRCLPANALEVLESMKLFFDLPGFIFIVGLDEAIVQRAVRSRFTDPLAAQYGRADGPQSVTDSERLEHHYIQKIFQVPYHVPPMLADDLDSLLESMYREADLGSDQLADFTTRVRPYLAFIAVERKINPREVKRYLNVYTLQTLIRPELDRNVILALQTLTFRHTWRHLYDAILTDSILFADVLRRYRGGEDPAFEDLAPELAVLPADLAEYLRSDLTAALCHQPSLDSYLSSLESTHGTPPPLSEAYRELGRLRAAIRSIRLVRAPDETHIRNMATVVTEVTSSMSNLIAATDGSSGIRLRAFLEQLDDSAKRLRRLRPSSDPHGDTLVDHIRAEADEFLELTNRVYSELRTLPRLEIHAT